VVAANGARWGPKDQYRISCVRRALAKTAAHGAIRYLERITKAGAIDRRCFINSCAHKMKEILNQPFAGVVMLRRFAGLLDKVMQAPVLVFEECRNARLILLSTRK
jgi:hypothetical protein